MEEGDFEHVLKKEETWKRGGGRCRRRSKKERKDLVVLKDKMEARNEKEAKV